jgi:OOP family OmpA-OmpF porin
MKKVTLAVAALALSTSISAFAATTGAYVGLGLGASRLNTPNLDPEISGLSYSYSQSRGGLGERIFAGYNFNQYIGAELGLANYAQSKASVSLPGIASAQVKYNMQALDLVAKAYLPIAQSGFNVYALAGAALVNSKVKGTAQSDIIAEINGSQTVTTRKVRPIVGVGASYDINRNVTTALEYSHIQGTGNLQTSDKAIPNADMISFNVSYNFG